MSSHHIVRDNQEPALVLDNLSCFPYDRLSQLLEWSPYVICGPNAWKDVQQYEIYTDMLLLLEAPKLAHPERVKEYHLVENNWLDKARDMLMQGNHRFANLITTDLASEKIMKKAENSGVQFNILTQSWRMIYVSEVFSKWLPAGTLLRYLGPAQPEWVNLEPVGAWWKTQNEGLTHIRGQAPFWVGLPY
jgi:thiamine pyrophosphokinase